MGNICKRINRQGHNQSIPCWDELFLEAPDDAHACIVVTHTVHKKAYELVFFGRDSETTRCGKYNDGELAGTVYFRNPEPYAVNVRIKFETVWGNTGKRCILYDYCKKCNPKAIIRLGVYQLNMEKWHVKRRRTMTISYTSKDQVVHKTTFWIDYCND